MSEHDNKFLKFIIEWSKKALKYKGTLSLEEFIDNEEAIILCAFCLKEVWEYASKLSSEFVESNKHIPWDSIKGMRNRIVHNYEGVNPTILYEAITISLPFLINDINNLIKE